MVASLGASFGRGQPSPPKKQWLFMRMGTPVRLHMTSIQMTQLALVCKHPFPFPHHLTSFFASHTLPKYLLCARHYWQLGTQRQVLWGLLLPATWRGIPWKEAKPPCHSLLRWSLWIAVCNMEAVAPCQGPGHSRFTHALHSVHIIPQLSILSSKYAIFFLPVIFPAVAVDVRAAGECEQLSAF